MDAAGNPLTGSYNMTFALYDAATGGAPLWTEAQSVNASAGVFSVLLGSVTPIPSSIFGGGNLYLGVRVGTDPEMTPRKPLGSAGTAFLALAVTDGSVTTAKIADGAVTQAKIASGVSLSPPDGSVTTAKLADDAVTAAKLDSTSWTDLALTAGFFSPPDNNWQRAQYRRIGNIVYLRGTISKNAMASIVDGDVVAFLPADFRPPKNLTFPTEPGNGLNTKHRVDICPDGTVMVPETAGNTFHVGLDGILFGIGE
jgi:hypothetical protein